MTKHEVRPRERLALLSLVFGGTPEEREPLQSHTVLTGKQWQALARAGYVELVKRGRGTSVVLTEDGWEWATQNLTGALVTPRARKASANPPKKKSKPAKPKGTLPLLGSVLERIAAFLERSGESLANVAQGVRVSEELPDRIRSTCIDLAGGVGKRVLLRELRRRLDDVRRETLDRALLDLQERERIVLYRLDNPAELTPADEQAALLIAGNPRHVVYIEV